ncbi:class I adenylate-forming enzyme family protein [Halorientalis halophila]|uniref:class I adenylate-forming enzyme family protein n=1 Tax=Halorientalis halophila TaxID=3108499 RepID=UPI0030091430
MSHPTVRDLLTQAAASRPDAVGLVDPAADEEVTFAAWDERVTRTANGLLGAGFEPGDHVAVMVKDSVELLVLLFAGLEIGLVVTPVSYRAPPDRLDYVLDHSEADGIAVDESCEDTVAELSADALPPIQIEVGDVSLPEGRAYESLTNGSATTPCIAVDEDDPALLLYTSGTTGDPKGVRHTHRNVVDADLMSVPYNRLRPSDTSVALGPLYHIGPLLANFMPALHVGATNVIQRDFDPSVTLDYVEDEGVTAIWGVPTHFNEILSEGSIDDRDTDGVRMIQYSGSAMPDEVVTRCREQFPDVDFVNAYGSTEIIFAAFLHPEYHDDHLGSIGRAVPNAEVRLVDPEDPQPTNVVPQGEEGEILAKTPTCMIDYYKDPEKTEAAIVDGWYRTGDLGRRGEEGFLYFVDRKDNMIISGGENIYPAEVEDVLHEHPDVQTGAVVGAPDAEWGQVVTAFVVPSDGDLDADVLDEYFQSSSAIEDFKRPRRYEFRDELPQTNSGKISRQDLREAVQD